MPKNLYDIRNYPKRSGTSQPARYKPVLHGAEVKIDERTTADFILFAQRLSRHIIFYNLNNLPQGNWESFLKGDITYHLAVTAGDKSKSWEDVWNELTENVEGQNGAPPAEEDHKRYFTWRFDFLYTLVNKMTTALANSNSLEQWKNDLSALLTSSNLAVIYYLLQAYHLSSATILSPSAGAFTYRDITLLPKAVAAHEISSSPQWVKELLKVNPLFDNTDFILGTGISAAEKISAATEYLNDLAVQLLRIYNSLNSLAKKYLSFSLLQYNSHEPHTGLFLAFLQLAEEHKTEMNGLLLKHLDFYYKQVLCVKEKSWQPDQAFVTFTMAKNVNEHFIAASSLLTAGKDTGKKDVFYKTLQDILVNKTELAEIRSFVFITNIMGDDGKVVTPNIRTKGGFYGSPVANSSDGKGKPLPAGQSWEPFRSSSPDVNVDQQIGISFYAAILHEAQGETRNFSLLLKFSQTGANEKAVPFIRNFGTLKILTEEDTLSPFLTVQEDGDFIKISFTISGKTKLSKAIPNASLIFGDKLEVLGASLDVIKFFQTASLVFLQLIVSDHKVKVTHVETAAGITDVSSPFAAFGGVPDVGSSFSVLEPFLEGKNVSNLTTNIEWASKSKKAYKVSVSLNGNAGSEELIALDDLTTSFNLMPDDSQEFFTADEIKVELLEELGHRSYGRQYLEAGIERSRKKRTDKTPFLSNIPEVPFTPIIKSITLTGNFAETILGENAFQNVFNCFPYGIKKFKSITDVRLLPSFYTTTGELSAKPSEGELYIGFKDTQPSQSLNVLVAVEEGSADPELQNPEVSWTYLSNDEWESFPESQFNDGTNGFIRSGILSMVLPDVDVSRHNLLPGGLFWLRAAVPFNQSNAVARLISVHTQAVAVEFNNQRNDPVYLGTNVPANTITNLFPKRAAVQKVSQPFASFGGRKNEEPVHLYTRTSERLRHKGRAVTAWDYENLILEAFPDIYKVKVLHHACPYKGAGNRAENIISKAGSLTVLAMPKTMALSSVYKPMISKSTLTAIYNFIRPLASPFTLLSVMNPLFEEIKLIVEVVFAGFIQDRIFYENQLNEDITRFLSPWAFNEGTEPDFGGVIYKSSIVDFIEELHYVDFVKRTVIIHAGTSSGDLAQSKSPASMLISATKHEVKGELATEPVEQLNKETIAFC